MAESELSRRSFIRTFAGGALGGAMLYAFPDDARAKYIIARDETVMARDEHFWQLVRTQFPLKRELTFLNNGTMGVSPFVVIDAIKNELEDVDRSARYGGWEAVRPKIAAFINAQPGEIALTHNVTDGINVIASGLRLKKGDEVILTNHEHAGNAVPWLARARRDGIVVKPVTVAGSAALTLQRINDAITHRTRVIAVPHILCTTGQILPAKHISRLAHDKGLLVMIDAAHTPGMVPLDVKDMECDFLATCGHKWMMGPKGTGFLYVREGMAEIVEPQWVGAGSDVAWDIAKGTLTLKTDAHRFEFATQSSALFVGLGAAVDFLHQLGMDNVSRRGKSMASYLRSELLKLEGKVEILTPVEEESCGSILGFRLKNYPYDALHKLLLEKHNIITRMVAEGGLNSTRISTHIYNTFREVDMLLDVIRSVA